MIIMLYAAALPLRAALSTTQIKLSVKYPTWFDDSDFPSFPIGSLPNE
jgi:hypothetical protein